MRLRLKGAKGVKAGPELTWTGADEMEVDFTGKTGLIAFDGENGSGKSSVLECLHHYPQLVSRGGALWSHFLGREAEKEFISTFMGHEYRSVIKMDADQGKQEGYLWIDGVPAVNGKITAYKDRINDIFGQPFTYFRSQFCPQKSKNTQNMAIENMTAGVFRELLQQFLNLQRYAQWEDTAKQAGNILSGQMAGIDQRIKGLEDVTSSLTSIETKRSEASVKVNNLCDIKSDIERDLSGKRTTVDTLKSTIQQNTLALARRADIQKQIDRLNGELATEKATAEKDIKALEDKYRGIKNDIRAVDTVLQDREAIEKAADEVKRLEPQAVDLQTNIDEKTAELPAHQQKVHDLETQIAQLRQQAKDLEGDGFIREITEEIAGIDRLIAEQERLIAENADDRDQEMRALAIKIDAVRRQTSALDNKGESCPNDPTCKFIADAMTALKELPEMEKAREKRLDLLASRRQEGRATIERYQTDRHEKLVARGARERLNAEAMASLQEQIRTLTHDLRNSQQIPLSMGEMIAHYRKELAAVRDNIAKQKALADRLPEIKVAEQRKADLEKQLSEVTAQGTARKQAWEAKKAEIEAANEYNYGALAAYRIDETAEASLKVTNQCIEEIEQLKIPAVEKEIQTAREKIATLQAELTRIEAAEKELTEARSQREALALKVSRWKYLQLGCGKTGLQNLRIDGAAPRIIYNANRLLSQAYGARYAVRLETQNEAGKEDLQIKIIMENGQEVYLDDISGGQRAWNVQALWLAMSLLNQEKSGRKYDYFCSDESDGALDVENAEKYTALYRPFMAEAGLSQLIYISHKPSCRAMADHVLQFEHGKNPGWN